MVSVAEFQQMQNELKTARDQIAALAVAQDTLKQNAQDAIAASEARSAQLARQLAERATANAQSTNERFDLVDFKVNKPEPFSGRRDESWKSWSRQFKTYCNVRKDGMKRALDWAETQTTEIDRNAVMGMGWALGEMANARLYDFLFLQCKGDAHVLIERHDGMGFEAWRQLARRYSPSGGQFELEMMSRLMNPQKAAKLADLPAAILRFERDIAMYQSRTGRQFLEEWKTPTFLRILPDSHKEELTRRFQMGQRDYQRMVDSVRGFSEEAWFMMKGPNDMDIDAANFGNLGNQDGEYQEQRDDTGDESVDWMGKGKGKGKGKLGTQRAATPTTKTTTTQNEPKGKGRGLCHWCGGDGHYIRECKAKKAGKPRTAKSDRPVKAIEDEGGDYEESLLGSISLGFDLCGSYRGDRGLCVCVQWSCVYMRWSWLR